MYEYTSKRSDLKGRHCNHRPCYKSLIRLPVGKPCPSDSDVLQQSKVADLMQATLIVQFGWCFNVIGLDAAYVEWSLLLEVHHQGDHGLLECCASGLWSLGDLTGCLHPFRPHLLQYCMAAGVWRRREGGGGGEEEGEEGGGGGEEGRGGGGEEEEGRRRRGGGGGEEEGEEGGGGGEEGRGGEEEGRGGGGEEEGRRRGRGGEEEGRRRGGGGGGGGEEGRRRGGGGEEEQKRIKETQLMVINVHYTTFACVHQNTNHYNMYTHHSALNDKHKWV